MTPFASAGELELISMKQYFSLVKMYAKDNILEGAGASILVSPSKSLA